MHTLKPYQVTGGDKRQPKMVTNVIATPIRATSAATNYYPQRAIQVVRVREFRSHDDHHFTKLSNVPQSSTYQNGTNEQHKQNNNNYHHYRTIHKNKNQKTHERGTNGGNVFECHQELKFVFRSEKMNVLVYNTITPLTFILPIVIVEFRDSKVHSFDDSFPFSANTTVMSYKKVLFSYFCLFTRWFFFC